MLCRVAYAVYIRTAAHLVMRDGLVWISSLWRECDEHCSGRRSGVTTVFTLHLMFRKL